MPNCSWRRESSLRQPCEGDPMRVLKFGGTSVADETAIARVTAIVAAEARALGSSGGPVVVVSALGGVTDQLLAAADIARRGHGADASARVAAPRERPQQIGT